MTTIRTILRAVKAALPAALIIGGWLAALALSVWAAIGLDGL